MERCFLSIDAGTSMVKAILFDARGKIISRADRPCELNNPRPDRYEMDLDAFYKKLCEAIRECMSLAGEAAENIAAVGVSAYMTGTIFLDGDGRQVGENVVWIDARTVPMIREWEKSGLTEKSYALTGTSLLPGSTLPLMRWWKDNRPEVIDRAKTHLFMKDWIRYKLTDEICTDPSEATCLPSDTFARGWSREVMALYGMEEYMRLLPPIVDSEKIAGLVSGHAAEETGLKQGIPVVCGLGDMLAGVLGAGAIAAGQGVTILGSTLLNSVIMDTPDIEPRGIGMTLATVGGKWSRFVNNTGGGTINSKWAMETFTGAEMSLYADKGEYYKWIDGQIENSPRCANGAMYLPYINSTGVTAPFYCVSARAQFTGIGLHHTRFDMLRAVYEGIAMAIRDCYDAVSSGVEQIRVSGGGSRSAALCQLISDICQTEITLPAQAEATALGSAILCAMAVGEYASIEEAVSSMTAVSARFTPDPNSAAVYDEWFVLFRKTSRAMIPLWEERMKTLERVARAKI